MEPEWLANARKYIGLRERPGSADNPKIVKMYAEAGFPGVKHDAVPWCAAFVGAVLKESGIEPAHTLWALDYAHWGLPLAGPVVGAIAVRTRRGGGHVGFVVSATHDTISLLGGNQGDQVCIASMLRIGFVGYRWPKNVPLPSALAPPAVTAERKAKIRSHY